jgi:hypothetical protein
VVFDDHIYLIGGNDGESVISSVEMYNPVQNTWQKVHNLHRAREVLAGAVLNDRIYAIGGQQDVHMLIDRIEWYDRSGDTWLEAAFNLPHPRAAHFYHATGDTFYMFGGYYYGLMGTAYKAQPQPGGYDWIQLDNLSKKRAYGATAQTKYGIYLIGGETVSGKTAEVEVFKPESEEYGPCYPLSSPRSGMCAVTVRDSVVYSIGGFETSYDDPVATVEYYYGDLISGQEEPEYNAVPRNRIVINGYPNPFNNAVTLEITIPETDRYDMNIYSISGRKLRTLYHGDLARGMHNFNWHVSPELASGLYFLTVTSSGYNQKYKLVYLK